MGNTSRKKGGQAHRLVAPSGNGEMLRQEAKLREIRLRFPRRDQKIRRRLLRPRPAANHLGILRGGKRLILFAPHLADDGRQEKAPHREIKAL